MTEPDPSPETGAHHQLGSHPDLGAPPTPESNGKPPAREMSPYPPLIIKYLVIYLYALTSAFQTVPTIDIATGEDGRSLYWSLALMSLSIAAIFGVVRSLITSRYFVEIVTTFLMLALLGSYSISIILRAIYEPTYTGLATAWLPVALSVFPACRLINVAPRIAPRKRVR